MVAPTVGTTPGVPIAHVSVEVLVLIHADSANSDGVKLTWHQGANANVELYEELRPNEGLLLGGFDADVFAVSRSGTQTYTVQAVPAVLPSPIILKLSSAGLVAAGVESAQAVVGTALAAQLVYRDALSGGAALKIDTQGVNASVSAANAANALTLEIRGLASLLSVKMATSGGTATVTVAVSVDNVTFITVGAFAAAANTVATFRASAAGSAPDVTGGAYTADATNGSLHPLAFRYVKVTVGAAGLGNTTTTTVSAK